MLVKVSKIFLVVYLFDYLFFDQCQKL